MLETLRRYALERLDEAGQQEDTHRRHAEHVAAPVEAGWTGMRGPARALGKKVETSSPIPAEGPTDPSAGTPADTAKAMKQEKLVQWTIPALTGGMLVLNALHGEQQRPNQVATGRTQRVKDALSFRLLTKPS